MPTLTARKPEEVPTNRRLSKAAQDQQLMYEGYVQSVGDQVGELELAPDEGTRSVKVSLRRASTRLGVGLEIWDVDGKVYFRREVRRGRPRKAK